MERASSHATEASQVKRETLFGSFCEAPPKPGVADLTRGCCSLRHSVPGSPYRDAMETGLLN